MLAEIRGRSQITIPAEIVKSLGICEGDRFEVIEKDGGFILCPVAEIPNEVTLAAMAEVQELKKNPNKKTYGSFAELLEDMDE